MAVNVQGPGSQTIADNCLSPSVQQYGGALPLTTEGGAMYVPGAAERTGWSNSPGFCWVAPKEEAGVSAAEATYGHSIVLPRQLQPPPCALQATPAKVDIPSIGCPNFAFKKVSLRSET